MSPREARRLMFLKLVLRRRFMIIWTTVALLGAWLIGTGARDFGTFFLLLLTASLVGASYTVFTSVRKQPWRTEPRTVSFGASGVTAKGASGSSTFPWSAFNHFSQDSRYFYLHMPDGAVSWVPRSAFTAVQAEAFLQYAKHRNA